MQLFSFFSRLFCALLFFCSSSLLIANEVPNNYEIIRSLQSKVKLIITDNNDKPIPNVEVVIYQSTSELGRGKTNDLGEVIIICKHSEENTQVTIKAYKKDYQKISISGEIHTPITSFAFTLKKSSESNKDIKLDILIEDKEMFKDDSKK